MGTQKEPLDLKQLAKLENIAIGFGKDSDTYKVFMILRYTGMHVSGLNTSRSVLHEEKDSEGDTIVVWKRPKKESILARTSILKHKNIDFDIEKFGKSIQNRRRKRSRQYFYEVVQRLGEEAGIPNISPMTLRHSLAIELLDNGCKEGFVAQILNCSVSTLKWYGKYTDKGKKDRLKKLGW